MKVIWITGLVIGSLLGCLTFMAAENFARATHSQAEIRAH